MFHREDMVRRMKLTVDVIGITLTFQNVCFYSDHYKNFYLTVKTLIALNHLHLL